MTDYALSLARSLKPGTIKAHSELLPPEPKATPAVGKRRINRDVISAAADEFQRLSNPKRGDIKAISIKHGVPANSIWHKLARRKKLGVLDPYHVQPLPPEAGTVFTPMDKACPPLSRKILFPREHQQSQAGMVRGSPPLA